MSDNNNQRTLVTALEDFLAQIAATPFTGRSEQIVLADLLATACTGIRQIGGPTPAMNENLQHIVFNNPAHKEILSNLTDGASEGWLKELEMIDLSCLPEGACIPGNPVDLAQMLAQEITFIAPPRPPAIQQDEGRPLQEALKSGKTAEGCEWSTGKLSGLFSRHCGAPLATLEERTVLRREFGYGSMPDNKPSLFRTQPYCPGHLRRSIQPTRKAILE